MGSWTSSILQLACYAYKLPFGIRGGCNNNVHNSILSNNTFIDNEILNRVKNNTEVTELVVKPHIIKHPTPYQLLHLTSNCSQYQIHQSYIKIQQAYNLLINNSSRLEYDHNGVWSCI